MINGARPLLLQSLNEMVDTKSVNTSDPLHDPGSAENNPASVYMGPDSHDLPLVGPPDGSQWHNSEGLLESD